MNEFKISGVVAGATGLDDLLDLACSYGQVTTVLRFEIDDQADLPEGFDVGDPGKYIGEQVVLYGEFRENRVHGALNVVPDTVHPNGPYLSCGVVTKLRLYEQETGPVYPDF